MGETVYVIKVCSGGGNSINDGVLPSEERWSAVVLQILPSRFEANWFPFCTNILICSDRPQPFTGVTMVVFPCRLPSL